MVTERAILHSDMNSFYASVEMLLDPKLRGKAVAVCGATEDRHGIVLAKSELAKKAGVKTGMVNWEARKCCPELILVPPQYEQYVKYSRLAHEIYYRYTDLVEPFGMDECWLDVSRGLYRCGTPYALAQELRASVREELGLTVSIGVSWNKIFAKLGSDMKKPDAVTEITKANYRERVWSLPPGELIYVGRSTEARLLRNGVHTIGELAATPPGLLQSWFGINGLKLWRYANGTDESRVMHKDFVSPVKSVGHGITCTADLENSTEVWKVILELSQDVGHRLRVHGLRASGVQLAIRTKDLNYQMYQAQLPVQTQLPCELAEMAFRLYQARFTGEEKVRALTVRAINLSPAADPEQLCAFVDNIRRDRRVRLEDTVEELRRRYGSSAVTYAVLLGDKKMPGDNRELVKMPGIMYS